MKPFSRFLLALVLVLDFCNATSARAATTPIAIAKVKHSGPVDFDRDVLPFLRANCLACHNRTSAKAGLILETPADLLKGGDTGPAIVTKKGASSLLVRSAAHLNEDLIMPPRGNKANAVDLTPEQLGLLKLWIDQGAKVSAALAKPIEWQPLPPGLNPTYAVALTDDGQFAACNRANQIFVYHLPTGRFITRLTDPALNGVAHHDQIDALAFNRDGTLLASGSFREIKLWQRPHYTETLRLTKTLPGAVTSVAVSPDEHTLAIGGADGSLRLWKRDTGKSGRPWIKSGVALGQLAFSPDGQWLISVTTNGDWSLWNTKAGKSLFSTNNIGSAQWTGTNQIAVTTTHGTVELWQTPLTPKDVPTITATFSNAPGHLSALTPAGTANPELFAAGEAGLVLIWPLGGTNAPRNLHLDTSARTLAIHKDGNRFASISTNGTARLLDASGKVLAELKGDRHAYELVAEKDRQLAVAREELTYRQGVLTTGTNTLNAANERVKKATDAHAPKQKDFEEKQKALADATTAKTAAEKAVADLNAPLQPTSAAVTAAEAAVKQADADLAATKAKTPANTNAVNQATATLAAKNKTLADAKQAYDKLANESKDKLKQATDKLTAATKTFTDAEAALKKSEMARNLTEDELKLANSAVTRAQKELEDARTAQSLAETGLKQAETALPAAKAAATAAERPVLRVLFSPDGQLLVTQTDDQRLQTWSAESGLALETFAAPATNLTSVTFTGAHTLACGTADGTVMLWDMDPAWRLSQTLGPGDPAYPLADRVNALQFSPDGRQLASGGGEPTRGGDVQLWDATTGKLLKQYRNIHSDTVLCLAFSPDGKKLATGGADKFARVLDLDSGKVLKSFEGHTHHVLGVSWKSDGRQLVTAGADAMLKTWDAVTGEKKKNLTGFDKEVTSVQFLGNTDQLLATSGDNKVRLLREDGNVVRNFDGPTDFMNDGAVTPDGKWAIAGGQDGVLRVWNANDGKPLQTFPPPAQPSTAKR